MVSLTCGCIFDAFAALPVAQLYSFGFLFFLELLWVELVLDYPIHPQVYQDHALASGGSHIRALVVVRLAWRMTQYRTIQHRASSFSLVVQPLMPTYQMVDISQSLWVGAVFGQVNELVVYDQRRETYPLVGVSMS
jgi:hypothetical protein